MEATVCASRHLPAAGHLHAAAHAQTGAKPASQATIATNKVVLEELPFDDRTDFENATRGFIARPEALTILDADGNTVWDLEPYKAFIKPDAPAPDTVNPSLWRNAQLNMNYGLFEGVPDKVWQVRGYDITNITFVAGDEGWIIMDPLTATETAAAAFDLVTQELGKRPIKAVIYSHSHVDHQFADRVLEIAGNAMSRRAA